MDNYQKYIHLSRYARWDNVNKRRETWEETVNRYFDFFEKRLKEKYKLNVSTRSPSSFAKDFQEAKNAVLNLEVMPSMRCMMTAGKALERDEIAGYNCFSGDTKFITDKGTFALSDCSGMNHKILIGDGTWQECEIKHFGKQETVEVNFNKTSFVNRLKFRVTLDHDWILSDGRKVKTKELTKKDRIPLVIPERKKYNSIDYRLGIMHGFIYGDGTAVKKKNNYQQNNGGNLNIVYAQKRVNGYIIRICSDIEDTLKYFNEYPKSYPKSTNGDPIVYMFDSFAKTHTLKELPNSNETEDYLVGFFRGWFAADGSICNNQSSICVDPDEEIWLKSNMERYGYYFGSGWIRKAGTKTNLGTLRKDKIHLKVLSYSLTKDDFILSRKKDKFKRNTRNRTFTFRGIVEGSNKIEDVYCAVVPKHTQFVLAGGILTGNCSFLCVDNPRAFDTLLYILCCFHPDTEIKILGGVKRIEDITLDDEVLSYNIEKDIYEYIKPSRVLITPSEKKQKYELEFDDGTRIFCTEDHLFLTGRGWIMAKDLNEEDEFIK